VATEGYEVGYGKPPKSTRFRKGRSGNSRGRPPGSKKELPWEHVLGQMVTVTENGESQEMTAEEAFLLYMFKQGANGDIPAARLIKLSIEKARQAQKETRGEGRMNIVIQFVRPGSVNTALTALGMGKFLYEFDPRICMKLEPWLVQQALDRLEDRRLTREEQEKIVKATRKPNKVSWPEWWEVRP
jgi:hypothetical protein